MLILMLMLMLMLMPMSIPMLMQSVLYSRYIYPHAIHVLVYIVCFEVQEHDAGENPLP